MGLFDIVDEMAKHQIEKTDIGDNRIYGVMVCVVTKNYDQKKQGFIQVSITSRDYEENREVWARMAFPYGGSKWGEYFVPEVGDQVLVAFEHGNIEKPYVIGSVPLNNSTFVSGAFDEKNKNKTITTKNGNTIHIVDEAEGDGEKDKMEIITSTGAHELILDNDKKLILLSDKEGKNKLEMKTGNGQMEIKADQKLTIKVGDSIEMYLNGANGTVTVKATKIQAEATAGIELKANGNFKAEGASMTVSGNSLTKVESSGPVTVSGTPIKLG